MKDTLKETDELSKLILSSNIKQGIQSYLLEIESNQQANTDILWLLDQMIGGIGGYCMSPNPVYNLFPGGYKRELFRPLQYARTDIELGSISLHARYVVQSSGMHLESVCRLFLKNMKYLGSMRFFNTTLGKSVGFIKQMNVLDSWIIDGLFCFVTIYNKSKHEINNDDRRRRLFSPEDGLTAYFSARILGQELLKYINFPESFDTYEISTIK